MVATDGMVFIWRQALRNQNDQWREQVSAQVQTRSAY